MQPFMLFPDITVLIIEYLNDELAIRGDDAVAYPEMPGYKPSRFVVVQRTGGPKRNIVTDEPTIVVESWGESDEDAYLLAQLCRGLLGALVGVQLDQVPIYRVDEVSGPARLPDPTSSQSRYTQLFSIALRGVESVSGS